MKRAGQEPAHPYIEGEVRPRRHFPKSPMPRNSGAAFVFSGDFRYGKRPFRRYSVSHTLLLAFTLGTVFTTFTARQKIDILPKEPLPFNPADLFPFPA
jgi:hypothetical protein